MGDEKKKRQTRGGKGMIKTKKETAEKERKVVMSRAPRGKKKYVTVVTGLGTFGKYDCHTLVESSIIHELKTILIMNNLSYQMVNTCLNMT